MMIAIQLKDYYFLNHLLPLLISITAVTTILLLIVVTNAIYQIAIVNFIQYQKNYLFNLPIDRFINKSHFLDFNSYINIIIAINFNYYYHYYYYILIIIMIIIKITFTIVVIVIIIFIKNEQSIFINSFLIYFPYHLTLKYWKNWNCYCYHLKIIMKLHYGYQYEHVQVLFDN